MLRIFLCITIPYLFFYPSESYGQRIEIVHSGNKVSIRGLSVVNEKVVWVCGNNGNVAKSLDGGKSWEWMKVEGHADRDFRDVEAFDGQTAIIMAVGEPALIFKTTNGGSTWKIVYRNDTPGMFLDAMEFWNDQSGIVVGDPINGRFFVARTFDEGFNWRPLAFDKLPVADSGEACFAASGTNVRALDRDEACFVTGGSRSRLFWKDKPVDLPIISGSATQGANSIAAWYKRRKKPKIVVVGGDFNADTAKYMNAAVSLNGGESWFRPSNPPNGYRSCVEFIDADKLVACGITGVDMSFDEGVNWNAISSVGFHVCRKAKKGKAVFLAGADGRIGKLVY